MTTRTKPLDPRLNHLAICRDCPSRGLQTCSRNGEPVYLNAARAICPESRFGVPARPQPLACSVSIIITVGPGMSRYLPDALASAREQHPECQLVVVFDNERPSPRAPLQGIAIMRGEWGSVQLARRAGLSASTGDAILFLDADNALPPGFVESAARQLVAASQVDPRVAAIYPDLAHYNEDWTPRQTRLAPPEWDRAAFERENFVDTSCLVWRHALEVSWTETVDHRKVHEDWHMWSQLVRDGWIFQRGEELTLKYRVRDGSMLSEVNTGDYLTRMDLLRQPLTLFIALSGREWAWPALYDWLADLARSEQGQYVRLVLCAASNSTDFDERIRREGSGLPFNDVRIYRQSSIRAGLAEEPRLRAEHEVQLVCSRIYNRLAQEATTPLVLILEDDILPQCSGEETIQRLLGGLDPATVAVSGVYDSRYDGKVTAWTDSSQGDVLTHVTREQIAAAPQSYLPIQGSGFGCLLIRREALRSVPHAVSPSERWYDPRFFNAIARQRHSVQLCASVECAHRSAPPTIAVLAKPDASQSWY